MRAAGEKGVHRSHRVYKIKLGEFHFPSVSRAVKGAGILFRSLSIISIEQFLKRRASSNTLLAQECHQSAKNKHKERLPCNLKMLIALSVKPTAKICLFYFLLLVNSLISHWLMLCLQHCKWMCSCSTVRAPKTLKLTLNFVNINHPELSMIHFQTP